MECKAKPVAGPGTADKQPAFLLFGASVAIGLLGDTVAFLSPAAIESELATP
jgi:hypothetical protein